MVEVENPKVTFREIFTGKFLQAVAAIIASFVTLSDGMHFGWTAPAIPILLSQNSLINTTKTDEKWLETFFLMGGLVTVPIAMYLPNKIGPRNSITVGACINLLSWILIALAPSMSYLYVGRFLAGFAVYLVSITAAIYLAEIGDKNSRGKLTSVIFITFQTGILLSYVTVPSTSFYVISIVGGSFIVIHIAVFHFMPESPYYLVSKNKVVNARKALKRLRAKSDNEKELRKITAAATQQDQRGNLLDLILVPSNRKVLLITITSSVTHFCGETVIIMNIHSILTESVFEEITPYTSAIISAVLMLAASICASYLIDRYGRKFLLITSSIVDGFILLCLAVFFNLKYLGLDLNDFSYVPVICVMVFLFVCKAGMGHLVLLLITELFPVKLKTVGVVLGGSLNLIFSMLSIVVYKRLHECYGPHVPFYLFSLFLFLFAVFTIFVIPETKGKSLEEIQDLLKGNKQVETIKLESNQMSLKC